MNDKLITALAEDLSPVRVKKPIRTTVTRFFMALIGTLLMFGIFFTVRSDLQEKMHNMMFLFSTFVALLACLISFFAIVFLSTPGRKESKYFLFFLGMFLSVLFFSLWMWPNDNPQAGKDVAWPCAFGVMKLGLLSLGIFGWAAKKLAPENPGMVGALCGVAAAGIGMATLAFSCSSENSYHLLIWHLAIPLIAFTMVGCLFGRKFLRW
jgi:hypothetical protein